MTEDTEVQSAKTPAGSWALKRKSDPRAAELVHRLFHRPEYSLHDRTKDPYEETNLVDDPEHAKVLARLKKRLHSRLAELGDSDPVKTEEGLRRAKGK